MMAALVLLGSASAAELEQDGRWFRNEANCMGAKIVVRSFCEGKAGDVINKNCPEQELLIQTPGKPDIRRDLLEKVDPNNFLVTTSLRCVSADKKPYLYFIVDNGGSCDSCESSAIIDLKGQWRRYGKRWFAPRSERRAIEQAEARWYHTPPVYLRNQVADEEK